MFYQADAMQRVARMVIIGMPITTIGIFFVFYAEAMQRWCLRYANASQQRFLGILAGRRWLSRTKASRLMERMRELHTACDPLRWIASRWFRTSVRGTGVLLLLDGVWFLVIIMGYAVFHRHW